jgi:AcrR family transcriptional regulator
MLYSLLMAQRPKNKMRTAIVTAALQEFATIGVAKATVPVIAAKAGTSVGNVYKYFPSKDALFEAAVPKAIVKELRNLLRTKVEALSMERDVDGLHTSHPYRLATEKLFQFALGHRVQILFLLKRSEGTRYEGFTEAVSGELSRLAENYSQRTYPHFEIGGSRRRSLIRIYRAFLEQIATILAEEETEQNIREAISNLTVYHLTGLQAFFGMKSGPVEGRTA